jgi:hypothetical protein
MSFKKSILCAFIFISSSIFAQVGSTGSPVNWIKIGETLDTFLQIDGNSLAGFDGPLGLAHRADFRFKGKTDENLTSQVKVAFMIQSVCDVNKGEVTIFSINSDGNPTGRGESFVFTMNGEQWPDALGRAMCKARKVNMDNRKVSPIKTDESKSTNKNLESSNNQSIANNPTSNGRTIPCTDTAILKCINKNIKSNTINLNSDILIHEMQDDDAILIPKYMTIGNKCDQLIKFGINQSSSMILTWTSFNKDGFSITNTYGTNACPPCKKDHPLQKVEGDKLYFNDESLNVGYMVSNYNENGLCSVVTKFKRINNIHYQGMILELDGCNNKNDLLHQNVRKQIKDKTTRNYLICNSK